MQQELGRSIIETFMWVNRGWLSELGLKTPGTTEEFRDMLRAFKRTYPDRTPMAGTEAHYSKQPYDFLFNAFIYNDVVHSRLLPENGVLIFAPVRDEWREALIYMRGLYAEGLYSPLSFTQDNHQLNQMANDPRASDGEYMNAQAALLHKDYAPPEYVGALVYTPEEEEEIAEIRAGLEAHVRETVIAYITGVRDIRNDADWASYLREFEALGLHEFLEAAQVAYDRGR